MSTNTKIEWTDTTGCAAPSGIARPRSRGDANSSDDPGFANLPERFSIDIHACAMAEAELGCLSPMACREMWQQMRTELVRRGYQVREYFSYDRMVQVADCVRETRIAP